MMKNNFKPDDSRSDEPASFMYYLTEGSVLWVLIVGIIILIAAAEFFSPW